MPAPDATPTAVATAAFSVPAPAVWAFRLDFTNLPDYNPDVTGVERVADGNGVGDASGVGARYAFRLADPGRTGKTHPVELWTAEVVEPTLVAAGMVGGNEAYEEFVIRPLGNGACEATLTLWVTLPDGLSTEVLEKLTRASFEQIAKELDLMQQVLER